MNKLKYKIQSLTWDKDIQGEAKEIKIKGKNNAFTILVNHASIISLLKDGKISIVQLDQKNTEYTYKNGFLKHEDNLCVISVLN